MRQFAVIGLGRFGLSVVRNLTRQGREVLAVDSDEKKVQLAAADATHVVQADATDVSVLRALGLRNFDVVIVAIGHDIQTSVVITLGLKELGVRQVIAKAQNDLHGQILTKVGADRVIFPERDMGARVARSLASSAILDFIELSPEYSIVEVTVNSDFTGRSLRELDLRESFGVNVMAVKRDEAIIVPPRADDPLLDGDVIVVIGHNDDLQRLERRHLAGK